jgi:DNA-binding NarL/FixJ family response regulator
MGIALQGRSVTPVDVKWIIDRLPLLRMQYHKGALVGSANPSDEPRIACKISVRKGKAAVVQDLDTHSEDRVNLVSPGLNIEVKSQLIEPTTVTDYQMAALRVMIADDFAMTRHFLRAILEGSPVYDVIGMADDGPHAVAMAERLQPDIVLLDMLMPRTYGTGVLSGILRVVPDARVVIVSGIDTALGASLLEAGAAGFLSKQVAPLEFLNRLRDVLDRSVVELRSQCIQPSLGDNLADGPQPTRIGYRHSAQSSPSSQTRQLARRQNIAPQSTERIR